MKTKVLDNSKLIFIFTYRCEFQYLGKSSEINYFLILDNHGTTIKVE